jgi:hypothetical protein
MGGLSGLWSTATSTVAALAYTMILAGTLAWAGPAKLRHPYGAALAAVHFRVLRRPRRAFGLVLGGWELLLAAGLVLPWTRAVAAVATLATSVAFAAVIGAALARRERFACACFGSEEEQVGIPGLVRAGLMALAAAAVVAVGTAGADRTDVAQAAVVAAFVLGVPVLAAAYRRTRSQWTEMDARLDWEWIMQEYHRSADR